MTTTFKSDVKNTSLKLNKFADRKSMVMKPNMNLSLVKVQPGDGSETER